MNIDALQKLAKLIRYYILTMTTTAGSGHTTSSLSAVELMTVLMFGGFFKADLDNTQNPLNDRLIFSKGHASPLFYSLYAAAGKISMDELLQYRKFTSPLEGHPTLEFPYTEAPTGSLGQGLSIGLGMALAMKTKLSVVSYQSSEDKKKITDSRLLTSDRKPLVFVLLGDGEMAEGSVWEAIQAASFQKVDNLVAILDVNRLGQSQPTMFEHHLKEYEKRFAAFGWETIVVKKGNDLQEVTKAFARVPLANGVSKVPTVIIAKTLKGAGIRLLQDKDNWHGKPLPRDLYEQAVKDLGDIDLMVRGEVGKPAVFTAHSLKLSKSLKSLKLLKYNLGDQVATRQAAGDALTDLMHIYINVVVLDGDVKNSLYTESAQKEFPDRYFEFFIAEQNMVGVATGMSRRGLIPFVTTFSAFMTRAYDQIRMAALAKANTKFIGSHAGVSIGEDGASQMGLEDLSMFRNIFGSTVLCPSDAVSTKELIEEMIKTRGISYIRVARPATVVIYDAEEKFPIGGSKVHKLPKLPKSPKKKVIIVAAGITVYEALKAQDILSQKGIETIVLDCYSIKPIDAYTLIKLTKDISTVLTVEDHWFEGGLGDAVLNVFACSEINRRAANPQVKIYKLAVTKLPHSGKPAELLEFEGIDANAIVKKIKEITKTQ